MIAITTALLCLLLMAAPAMAGVPAPWTGQVVRAKDGDGLIVARPGGQIDVRIWGVDAPELNQPWGRQAHQWAARLTGQRVRVSGLYWDRNHRLVARVGLPDGRDLAQALCAAGAAWWWQRYAPVAWNYAEAMMAARKERKGLWAADDPVPPWKWRDRKRTALDKPSPKGLN